ncbi:MAG: TIGR02147 family protein [Fibrobacteria bacterium]|nr:TIGR02147 family protein [Fibrobacteria bacterium]
MDAPAGPEIFEYLDYRAYLRDYYQARKAKDAFFSYRFMAGRTGVDAGWIAKVLAGQEHLSQRAVDPFARLCGLGKREAEFFSALVSLAKSRSTQERAEAFERAMSLKSPSRATLGERQLAFYGRWWHAPIRSLLGLLGRNSSVDRVAGLLRPRVSIAEVRASIELLEGLGLVKRGRSGWELQDAFVSNPPEGAKAAVRAYQADTLDLAKEALENHPPQARDISSLTLAFDHRDLPSIRERIAALRDNLIQLSAETPRPDCVYQVNMQVFPVTAVVEEGR